jgi:DNA topoisomerase I
LPSIPDRREPIDDRTIALMIQAQPDLTARMAGLRHVSDAQAGIRRVRAGRGFRYVRTDGGAVTNEHVERIKALVIPPAWESVWVCLHANGHLQATGTDVRGRKQYRYHDQWTVVRNECKFDGMHDFGRALPIIRRQVNRHLRLPGLPREKVLACVVRLLDQSLLRVGNDEYARDNDSYGLTTIRNGHVKVQSDELRFCFRAKSGKVCELSIHDRRLAKIVARCQELPGQELFCFVDRKGRSHDIESGDVNAYLFALAGKEFTAKDFRTWGGTVVAAAALHDMGRPVNEDGSPISDAEFRRREVAAIKAAAGALFNTVATCRKYYVHPRLGEAYRHGVLHEAFAKARRSPQPRGLRVEERGLLHFMRSLRGLQPHARRLSREVDRPKA